MTKNSGQHNERNVVNICNEPTTQPKQCKLITHLAMFKAEILLLYPQKLIIVSIYRSLKVHTLLQLSQSAEKTFTNSSIYECKQKPFNHEGGSEIAPSPPSKPHVLLKTSSAVEYITTDNSASLQTPCELNVSS